MAFDPSVERWRFLATQFKGDAPPDFLLDWIAKESGGNRCNLTTSAGFPEVGLFQLDPGNAAQGGTDQATLRVGCDGQTDVGSDDDRLFAMASGVEYVKALKVTAHQKLNSVGVDWDESDPGFWAIVRLQHAAGSGAATKALQTAAANLGRGPSSWEELTANVPRNHWLDVAAENASWAAGWSPSSKSKLLLALVALVGTGVGMWLTTKFRRVPL